MSDQYITDNGSIDITCLNLKWYNTEGLPNILTLGQIKQLYLEGNYLYDNELLAPLTFQDISFRIISSAYCPTYT